MPAVRTSVVSPFEGNLLTIARAIVGEVSFEQAAPMTAQRIPRPKLLSRTAIELVSETLISGCVLQLARLGGWWRERHLRDGKPLEGRLWDRSPTSELALQFTRHSLDWLVWLTAVRPDDGQGFPIKSPDAFSVADLLVLFLTYREFREGEFVFALRAQPIIASHGLIRLAYPDDFSSVAVEPHWTPWWTGLGALILEALQDWLADRWIELLGRQREIGDWEELAALGREQDRLLTALIAAAESAGRPDLIRFLLRVASAALPADVTKDVFCGGLHGAGPPRLGERIAMLRSAVSLPRQLLRLRDWERWARGIGYLDDGYAAAQLWLADWERFHGDTLAERAERVIAEIEPLTVGQ
jgi:hypothetical protein